jgi:hypothetical protein
MKPTNQISTTIGLLTDIFGKENLPLALDYVQLLVNHKDQRLPIVFVFSPSAARHRAIDLTDWLSFIHKKKMKDDYAEIQLNIIFDMEQVCSVSEKINVEIQNRTLSYMPRFIALGSCDTMPNLPPHDEVWQVYINPNCTPKEGQTTKLKQEAPHFLRFLTKRQLHNPQKTGHYFDSSFCRISA